MSNPSVSPSRMSPLELRATASLAAIFALRMLGLFMVMPVFSIYAKSVPGGDNATIVGLAIGIYGLTQSLLYIPYGWASDRLGRKPVIVAGLLVFALGSAIAALAPNMTWIVIGRAVQGAGAISSAITAFVADLTDERNRTKAMAMIGGSIGIAFGVAIIAAPIVFRLIGMSGLFAAIGVLAVLAIVVVLWVVPEAPTPPVHVRAPFGEVLRNPELLRLNLGVFVLHATQTALFVVLPHRLEEAGLPVAEHWHIYLPVMALSFVLMVPAIIAAEKHGRMKAVMLTGIAAVLIGQLCFAEIPSTLVAIGLALLVYFTGFNILEASQPSMVSKLSPGARKGAAMGVYNTTQALGLFAGGALGGLLARHNGGDAVFFGAAALAAVWLLVAAGMRSPARRR
ncbi:MFS transporter [Chitinasiproducens palmae]|nr:MFS transporter [Chitinasiproducens palmae]